MATESILKEFVVLDEEAFSRMLEDLNESCGMSVVVGSGSLEYGREKLKYFEFTDVDITEIV